MGASPPDFYGELTGMQLPHTKTKPPPMTLVHEVTLQELYNSATKKVSYTRKKLKPDGMVRRGPPRAPSPSRRRVAVAPSRCEELGCH